MDNKIINWVLRVAIFGEFFGHGIFALQGKKAWLGWNEQIGLAQEFKRMV